MVAVTFASLAGWTLAIVMTAVVLYLLGTYTLAEFRIWSAGR